MNSSREARHPAPAGTGAPSTRPPSARRAWLAERSPLPLLDCPPPKRGWSPRHVAAALIVALSLVVIGAEVLR